MLLEVVFEATGKIQVLRVVRGLGYGLDDAAVRAAEQIRFKPALQDGRALGLNRGLAHHFPIGVIRAKEGSYAHRKFGFVVVSADVGRLLCRRRLRIVRLPRSRR